MVVYQHVGGTRYDYCLLSQCRIRRITMADKTWIIVEDDQGVMTMVTAMCTIWNIEPIKLIDGFAAMQWIEKFNDSKYTGPIPEFPIQSPLTFLEIYDAVEYFPGIQRNNPPKFLNFII